MRRGRLSVIILLTMAAVLYAALFTISGCIDPDEALPHYRKAAETSPE